MNSNDNNSNNSYVDSSSLYKKENAGFFNSATIPTNWNSVLIIILVFLLIFSLIGINILGIFGEFIVNVIANIKPLVIHLLKSVGLITGTVIDTTGDVVQEITDAVGGGLIELSKDNGRPLIQSQRVMQNEQNMLSNKPEPSGTDSSIQSQKRQKGGFCLVGNYAGKNGCIEIDEYDKCLSGKVFPSRSLCLSAGENNVAN
jgi:hypothetical protein